MNFVTKAVTCAVLVSCPMGSPERWGLCAVARPVLVRGGCVELHFLVVKIAC